MTKSAIPTPLGFMHAGATAVGVVFLLFEDQTVPNRIKEWIDAPGDQDKAEAGMAGVHLERLAEQIHAYFAGRLAYFSIPTAAAGTPFQQQVWQAVSLTQPGDTISYSALSRLLGDAGAVRAVARANADNPILLLMPCHRVIGSSGTLTGYSGGLERKAWLLEHERKMTGKSVPTLF